MVAASFLVTVGVFADLMSKPSEERRHIATAFHWVPVGSLKVDLAFLADPLSITMCLFVTGIGALIHLYACGYMHGDPRFSKFFLYLNLFAFSMLTLVLGSNLLVTFLGWEGVGTCSYFLISFWHERESAATAGKKAFIAAMREAFANAAQSQFTSNREQFIGLAEQKFAPFKSQLDELTRTNNELKGSLKTSNEQAEKSHRRRQRNADQSDFALTRDAARRGEPRLICKEQRPREEHDAVNVNRGTRIERAARERREIGRRKPQKGDRNTRE